MNEHAFFYITILLMLGIIGISIIEYRIANDEEEKSKKRTYIYKICMLIVFVIPLLYCKYFA
jgi:hypothetical protein